MRTTDNIRGVTVPTLVLAPQESLNEKDFTTLVGLSDKAKLRTAPLPATEDALNQEILRFVLPTPEPGIPKPVMR
jgi:hypothetical protein